MKTTELNTLTNSELAEKLASYYKISAKKIATIPDNTTSEDIHINNKSRKRQSQGISSLLFCQCQEYIQRTFVIKSFIYRKNRRNTIHRFLQLFLL